MQVLVDGTDVNNARVIQNSIRATTNFWLQSNKLLSGTQKITTKTRLWFNPGRKESLYIVPGIYGVILWVFPSMLTAIAGFLTAFLLSGFIYRIDNIPFPLSLISSIIPARYYILVTRDAFVQGTGWAGVWYVPLIVGLIGLVIFMAATKNLKRMQLPD